jgi:hypothetical protein
VPDDLDYAWLGEFLDNAAGWSAKDLETARFLLANQRRALDEAHPRDATTRERLRGVVDALESAIEQHAT